MNSFSKNHRLHILDVIDSTMSILFFIQTKEVTKQSVNRVFLSKGVHIIQYLL